MNIPSAVILLLLTNLLNTLCKRHFMQISFSEVSCENTCIRPKSTRMPGINTCCRVMGRSEQFLKSSRSRMWIHFFLTPFSRQISFWVSSFEFILVCISEPKTVSQIFEKPSISQTSKLTYSWICMACKPTSIYRS